MELSELTEQMFKNHPRKGATRIVPVMWEPKKGMLFLVEDVHCPQVPGFPAISLCDVNEGLKKAYDLIEATYKKFDYKPIYHDRKEFYFRGLDTKLLNQIRRS